MQESWLQVQQSRRSRAAIAQPRRIRDVIRYERLKENDPRDGFVENEQYQVLNAGAEELWLKSILATSYTFGFRSSELTEMKVRKGQPEPSHHHISRWHNQK
jgi:hypothetical protein